MEIYTNNMNQNTTKDFLKWVSERIRTYRKSLGLTQEQLADLSSLSHNYIARIELGSKTPSISTLFRIAEALNVNPADLISEEPSTAPSYTEQIGFALNCLNDAEAEFAIEQLRATTDYLKRQHKD